jgi:zinc finger protein
VNTAVTRTTRFRQLEQSDVRLLIIHNATLVNLNFIAEGAVYTARILEREDLDRQLVKSSSCTVTIPEFELTIPSGRGQLTTVEGLLRDIIADLGADQPLRRIENEAAYQKIQDIINGFQEILADSDDEERDEGLKESNLISSQRDVSMKPFTVILDDPAGNSFVEFRGSMADPKWNMRTYHRTKRHNIQLGLAPEDADQKSPEEAMNVSNEQAAMELIKEHLVDGAEDENEEIYIFPGTCSSCGHPLDTMMKRVNIPYFQVSE